MTNRNLMTRFWEQLLLRSIPGKIVDFSAGVSHMFGILLYKSKISYTLLPGKLATPKRKHLLLKAL